MAFKNITFNTSYYKKFLFILQNGKIFTIICFIKGIPDKTSFFEVDEGGNKERDTSFYSRILKKKLFC